MQVFFSLKMEIVKLNSISHNYNTAITPQFWYLQIKASLKNENIIGKDIISEKDSHETTKP